MHDQLPAILFIIISLVIINTIDWPINMIIVIIIAIAFALVLNLMGKRKKCRKPILQ